MYYFTVLNILLVMCLQVHHVKSDFFSDAVRGSLDYVSTKFFDSIRYIKNKIFSTFVDNSSATTINDVKNDTLTMERVQSFADFTVLPMEAPRTGTLHGRKVETHNVRTEDGYIIKLHRIIRPKDMKPDQPLAQEVVLLHHGLLGSSVDWIILGPEKSLPFMLSNRGCDVWLINSRGNYYSKTHTHLRTDSAKFWNFSFHEMGYYDLPAVIDYVNSKRTLKDKRISFVGHSMGASAILVTLSCFPKYNNILRLGILLAPLVLMSEAGGPLSGLAKEAKDPAEEIISLFGPNQFFSKKRLPKSLTTRYCNGSLLCTHPLFFLTGSVPNIQDWSDDILGKMLYYVPGGGSTTTILHYIQLIQTGKFQPFRGHNESDYKLNSVTLPIVLFSSTNDNFAPVADVLKLYFNLPNPIEHFIIHNQNITHTDFVWGTKSEHLVFDKIFYFLSNGLNHNATNINEV